MTANGSPTDLVAVVTGVAVLLIIAVIYAVLTAEPGGNHHAPRTPLRVRLGSLLADAARSAYDGLVYMLRLLAWDPRDGAKPDTLHVRPQLDGHVRETPGGGLHVVATAMHAPQAARRPELDDTLTDVTGMAIKAGTEVAR
jgi:hypothetical protein